MSSHYGECGQNMGQMPYYAAPRGFNTVAEHIKAGQAVEHIPHRLFVGGFGTHVNEANLREHFERFFTIRDVKVIRNPEGVSKGYGFVTFDTEEEAKAVQAMSQDKLKLNGKTLNLGPALRKMVHSKYQSDYATATPNGQYTMTSPTMQMTYTYPSSPHTGAPYMMGYPPQGMVPVSHSLSGGEQSSHSQEGSGGEEPQQVQPQPQPPALVLHPGVQNTPQPLFSYYVPPPTPMTPTFRSFPYAPLYYPSQTPPMIVDGAALYPTQMMSPMMYHPGYLPPTPLMDGSFTGGYQTAAPAAKDDCTTAATDEMPLLSQLQQQQHYPPLVAREKSTGEEQSGEIDQMKDGVMAKQLETSLADIRLSYASIAAKLKGSDANTVAKETEQISTQMGSMNMTGAGGDYAAATKNGDLPRV